MERVRKLSTHLETKKSEKFIRQFVWVVDDFESSIKELATTLDLVHSFRDPEIAVFGLKNCVFQLGNQFLEVVSPLEEGKLQNVAYKQLVKRKGDGGYMIMLQTNEFGTEEIRLNNNGFKTVLKVERKEILEVHLHPKNTGHVIFSFSQPNQPENWVWGGPDWQQRKRYESKIATKIVGVSLQVDELNLQILNQFKKLLDTEGVRVDEKYVYQLSHGHFIEIFKSKDGRGNGLNSLYLETLDRTKAGQIIQLSGVNIHFV